jgi:hypothetical protein
MEIKYLVKMKNNPKIGSFENEGVSEIEIERLEKELKINPRSAKSPDFVATTIGNKHKS